MRLCCVLSTCSLHNYSQIVDSGTPGFISAARFSRDIWMNLIKTVPRVNDKSVLGWEEEELTSSSIRCWDMRKYIRAAGIHNPVPFRCRVHWFEELKELIVTPNHFHKRYYFPTHSASIKCIFIKVCVLPYDMHKLRPSEIPSPPGIYTLRRHKRTINPYAVHSEMPGHCYSNSLKYKTTTIRNNKANHNVFRSIMHNFLL